MKPRKRIPKYDSEVRALAQMLLDDAGISTDVNLYVADQSHGWYRPHWNAICIPYWIWKRNRGTDYLVWYVAHELSHAIAQDRHGYGVNHGPRFMEILKQVCPEWCIKFECGYKPRLAKAAGIGV